MTPRPIKSPLQVFALFAAWLVCAPTANRLPSQPAAAAPVGSEPALCVDHAKVDEAVLFAFDDYSVPFTANLQLSMEAAEKHPGNPVMPIGAIGQPDEWQLRYYGTIIRIGDKFLMWYNAASRDGYDTPFQVGREDFRGWRFAYAESKDGVHWVKPDLGLTDFRGSRHNNLIGMPAGFRGYHTLVRYEPEEADASRRFKMLALLCQTGDYIVPGVAYGEKGALYDERVFMPMYSADGLRWRIADELLEEGGKKISPKFHLLESMEGSGLYKWKGMYYVASQSWGQTGHAAMPPMGGTSRFGIRPIFSTGRKRRRWALPARGNTAGRLRPTESTDRRRSTKTNRRMREPASGIAAMS